LHDLPCGLETGLVRQGRLDDDRGEQGLPAPVASLSHGQNRVQPLIRPDGLILGNLLVSLRGMNL
jgi:hypothetical protein